MNPLSASEWTVIARSYKPGSWAFVAGHVQSDVFRPDLVVMHRKTPHGWEIIARIAGPAWRRWQRSGRVAR